MPVFGSEPQSGNGMQQHRIQGGAFQFSAVRPEELGAAEYTLVTIVTEARLCALPLRWNDGPL